MGCVQGSVCGPCVCVCRCAEQGKLEDAVPLYEAARETWVGQPVVPYSLANALIQLGRLEEARTLITSTVAGGEAGPFQRPLQGLLEQVETALLRQREGENVDLPHGTREPAGTPS